MPSIGRFVMNSITNPPKAIKMRKSKVMGPLLDLRRWRLGLHRGLQTAASPNDMFKADSEMPRNGTYEVLGQEHKGQEKIIKE
jgi:hypothetical protein